MTMSIDRKSQVSEPIGNCIPVIELFRGEVRQSVVRYAVVNVHRKPFTRSDILDHTEISSESFRKHKNKIEEFGILDCISDECKNIPHYRPAETDVVRSLRMWGLETPLVLFETRGSRKLVEFFLVTADPNRSYSINGIQREGGPGRDAVANNIDDLVNAGLVSEVDGSRGTEYLLDSESETYNHIQNLNRVIAEYRS